MPTVTSPAPDPSTPDPHGTGATAQAAVETTAPERRRPPLPLLVLTLTTLVALMLLAFATPALHSGAKDLPVAVSAPAPVVSQLEQVMAQKAPGALDLTTVGSPAKVTERILDREAVGGIVVGADGITVQTASAAGAPYTPVLKGLGAGLEATGQKVTYVDVAPLPAGDRAGVALTALGLPLIFGGMATAALMSTQVRGTWRRLTGAVCVAVLAGLVTTAVLQYGFEVLQGSYWRTAACVTLGIAAISLTVLGLESWLGFVGLGLGAILMLFVANPLSGLATGPQWLPHPWGAVGQYLPVGAAGTAIRSAAYFDGRGSGTALVVLACWALGGLLLAALAHPRRSARD